MSLTPRRDPLLMSSRTTTRLVRALLTALALCATVSISGLTSVASADLQSQIAAGKSAVSALQSQIAAQTAQIQQTAGGVAAARARLASIQVTLDRRIAELRTVQ